MIKTEKYGQNWFFVGPPKLSHFLWSYTFFEWFLLTNYRTNEQKRTVFYIDEQSQKVITLDIFWNKLFLYGFVLCG